MSGPGVPAPPASPAWHVARVRAPAAAHHGRSLPSGRTVTLCRAERAALVLGSTQPLAGVDAARAAAAGVDVVRRRSGGGAVLLAPGQVVWADVLVPRGDALWDDDVGRAFHWLGQAWVAALGRLGLSGAAVHRGGLVSTPWSRRVCFAGLGPGEVTLGGRKVVGMAQRRTREGALFQCACLLAWEPAALVDILALDGEEARAAAVSELSGVAVGIGPTPVPAVEAAFVDVLP